MQTKSLRHIYNRTSRKKAHYPWNGQLELTYRCGLDCVHCYCKEGYALHASRHTLHAPRSTLHGELTTLEWKKILDDIHEEGCLWLCLSGGDPLVRDDFLEIYSYAKGKGFIINIFTNGEAFSKKILDYLEKSPPFSIEITLNGITKKTYESITQVKGSFEKVIATIKEIHKRGVRLILKSNCLKQNKDEIDKVKAWTEEILGRPSEKKYRFKYDPMIYPALNGNKTPTQYRLSFEELAEARKKDPDIWEEYQKGLHADLPDLNRDKSFLYRCNAWMEQFFVNPYGRLKFCMFTDKFSVDLKETPFGEGFYNVFPQVLNERFKTDSKCQNCSLRAICYHCPARAYLETGDEEAPVAYYCEMARALSEEMANKRQL